MAVPPGVDETPPRPLKPGQLARWAAVEKARAVAVRFEHQVVLAADTVVALDGQALGKPAGPAEARRMLRRLSGRSHTVFTAVAVVADGVAEVGLSRTRVTFKELSRRQIDAYVAGGDPLDKAGAYGIQSGAGPFVAAVDGPLDTVIGLPMRLTTRLLRAAGVHPTLALTG